MYIDIDNTIWDVYPAALDAGASMFGKRYTLEEIGSWWGWVNAFGKNYFKVFEEALAPEKVAEREMFPGVEDALWKLIDKGFWLHFMSHNPKPNPLQEPVREWISSKLRYPQFDLTIFGARNCKIEEMKKDETAFGIIEDKPSTLRKAVKEGYEAYAKITDINKNEKIPGAIWFDDWNELPKRVPNMNRVRYNLAVN